MAYTSSLSTSFTTRGDYFLRLPYLISINSQVRISLGGFEMVCENVSLPAANVIGDERDPHPQDCLKIFNKAIHLLTFDFILHRGFLLSGMVGHRTV